MIEWERIVLAGCWTSLTLIHLLGEVIRTFAGRTQLVDAAANSSSTAMASYGSSNTAGYRRPTETPARLRSTPSTDPMACTLQASEVQ